MKSNASFVRNQYCRRIENDCDDNIVEELRDIINAVSASEIIVLNFYKEIALTSPLQITHVSDESLTCTASDAQFRAITINKYTLIRSSALKHDVFAAAHPRLDSKEIVLSDLTYIELYTDRRSSVRVKMDCDVTIVIEAGRNKFSGTLKELSLNGCSVEIADRQLLENYKYFYLNIELPFKTSKPSNSTRLMSKLIRCESLEPGYGCIFVFEHDNITEDQIGRVLALRQTEIIRELK
jgi:hypothetical protein